MNDSDASVTEMSSRLDRLERSNSLLRVTLVGVLMLGTGLLLGGQAEATNDSAIAHVATDGTIYRLYESGHIEYLRVEDDPPRTADGVFNWGVVKIDARQTLSDRP